MKNRARKQAEISVSLTKSPLAYARGSSYVLPTRAAWMRVILRIMKIWQYGRFGSIYGAWVCIAIGIGIMLYTTIFILLDWPEDGTGRWFFGGFFSLLFFFVVTGYLLGIIGGFVFGVIGSFGNKPFIWAIGGAVGGIISSLIFEWIMWRMTRHRPDFLTFFRNDLPINLLPSMILAVIGWSISSAISTGRPKRPFLHRLKQQ